MSLNENNISSLLISCIRYNVMLYDYVT